jgi:hypothetical protein
MITPEPPAPPGPRRQPPPPPPVLSAPAVAAITAASHHTWLWRLQQALIQAGALECSCRGKTITSTTRNRDSKGYDWHDQERQTCCCVYSTPHSPPCITGCDLSAALLPAQAPEGPASAGAPLDESTGMIHAPASPADVANLSIKTCHRCWCWSSSEAQEQTTPTSQTAGGVLPPPSATQTSPQPHLLTSAAGQGAAACPHAITGSSPHQVALLRHHCWLSMFQQGCQGQVQEQQEESAALRRWVSAVCTVGWRMCAAWGGRCCV